MAGLDEEPQAEQDARIKRLWKSLHEHAGSTGELDLEGLKKGLHKIDHRSFLTSVASAGADSFVSTSECR